MSWSRDNLNHALTVAAWGMFKETGGCPLDKGECMFPSLMKDQKCDYEHQIVSCWKHYYLTRWDNG